MTMFADELFTRKLELFTCTISTRSLTEFIFLDSNESSLLR